MKLYKVGKDKNIREYLISQKNDVEFLCNGNGTCGKCIIKVIKGYLDINDSDRKFLTDKQLENGLRLSCQHQTDDEIEFFWLSETCDGVIESDLINDIISPFKVEFKDDIYYLMCDDKIIFKNYRNTFVGIAVDIGTTTLVVQMIDLVHNKLLGEKKFLNSQKRYGADVISRIKHASMYGAKDLHEAIITDIENSIVEMVGERKIEFDDIVRISVSGNNVMNHLFLKVNPEPLGYAPFMPVFINPVTVDANDLFSFFSQARVSVIGSFSGFVGGDIMSGVLSLGELDIDWFLLVDLGTNGEMVLGNKNVLYVTSTAVGPALEGGNISCGIGSVSGAINIVKITDDKILVDTINHTKPIGVCGSGVIDLVSELLKSKQLLPNGKLKGAKEINVIDDIYFTQKDIRQIQFAKSAVRSGIEMLVKVASISYQQIKQVYLSGGLGNNANLESVINIGMIPSQLKAKVKSCGNSSLSGAIYNLFQLDSATKKTIHHQTISKIVNLVEYDEFKEMYMSHFNLEKY